MIDLPSVMTLKIATAKKALSGVTVLPSRAYVTIAKNGTKVKFEVKTPM